MGITKEQKTILLVEDSATFAMVEAEMLRRFGYRVITASSAEEAVRIATGDEVVNLILMDIELGEGMDGTEAARQVLSVKHIPIVFLTSHAEKEYVDRVREITRYGYVIKNSGDFVLQSSIEMAFELYEANRNIELKMELLQQANESLRKLFLAVEQSFSSIVITDLNGNIEYVNKAFVMLTGYSFAEAVGQNPRILQSGKTPRATYDDLWASLTRGEMWKGEFINLGKDGTEYTEFALISPVRQPDGRITHYIAIKDDITDRKQAEEQIRNLAFYDPLTKLPNRRLLDDRLRQTMAASRRSNCYGAVMFLDLDNFKPLNDLHGHSAGDLLLIEVAQRLNSCVREVDTVARFGGDEFVVILSKLNESKEKSVSEAHIVAEKIQRALAESYFLKLQQQETAEERTIEHHCTVSIGVVLFIDHMATAEAILKWADIAMYKAKEDGRNLIHFWEEPAASV